MPLQLAPNESIFFSARRHRVNTPKDAPKTALNQIFDYFDMEVLQTPLPKPAPARPLPIDKARDEQNQQQHCTASAGRATSIYLGSGL